MPSINELSALIVNGSCTEVKKVIEQVSAIEKDASLFKEKDAAGYTLLQRAMINLDKFSNNDPTHLLVLKLIDLLIKQGSDVNARPYPMLHLIFKYGLTDLFIKYHDNDTLKFEIKDLQDRDALFHLPDNIDFLTVLASTMIEQKIPLPLHYVKLQPPYSYKYNFHFQFVKLLSLLTGAALQLGNRDHWRSTKPSKPYYQHLYVVSLMQKRKDNREPGFSCLDGHGFFVSNTSELECANDLFKQKYYMEDNPEAPQALEIARDILESNTEVLNLHTYAEALKLDHGTAWLMLRDLKNAPDLPPDFDIELDPYVRAMEAVSHPVPPQNVVERILGTIEKMPISETKKERMKKVENLIFQGILAIEENNRDIETGLIPYYKKTLILCWSRLVEIAGIQFPGLISYHRFQEFDDGEFWLKLLNLKNVSDLPEGYDTFFDPFFSQHAAKNKSSTTQEFINSIRENFKHMNNDQQLKLEERFLVALFTGKFLEGKAKSKEELDKYNAFFKELSNTLSFSGLILIYGNIINTIPMENNGNFLKSKDVKITERLKAMPAYDSCMDVLMYLMPEKNLQDLSKAQKDNFNAFFSEPVKNKLIQKFSAIKVDLLYHLIYQGLISNDKLFNALIYTDELKKKLSFFMQKNLFDPHYPLYKNASAPPASVPSTALSTAAPTRKSSLTGQTNPFFAPPPPTVPPTEVPTAANTQPPIGENSWTAADLAALQRAAKELEKNIQIHQESGSPSNNSNSASQTSGEKTPAKIYPEIPKAVDVPSPKLTTSSTPMNLFSSPSSSPALSHGESVDERIKSLRQTIEDLNTSIRLFTDMDDMEGVAQNALTLAEAAQQYTYFLNLKKFEEKKPDHSQEIDHGKSKRKDALVGKDPTTPGHRKKKSF